MTLVAENLGFGYRPGRPVVAGFDLQVEVGERVALNAPSGAGKTTVCKLLAGYLRPQSGSVTLDGRPLPARGYCPVQMVWQHPEKSVNPLLPMRTVVAEGDQVAPEVLAGLGIEDAWLDRYPRELSGGEIQRFCIARALGQRTKFLIADEITTMLDAIAQASIWQFLLAETERRGLGILIVTHTDALAQRLATRQVALGRPG